MNKITKILAVVAVTVVIINCVLATAQVYANTGTWTPQPGRTDYSYGYAGVDSNGRVYGNAAGNGGYRVSAYDPTGRRLSYEGGAYQGVNRDSPFSYGRDGYYGRDNYNDRDGYYGRDRYGSRYGYWNSAVSTQRTGCVYWLTFGLTVMLALKVFA